MNPVFWPVLGYFDITLVARAMISPLLDLLSVSTPEYAIPNSPG
jgi:hypothetical protein